MSQIIEAIYENGIIRPISPIKGIENNHKLKITILEDEGLFAHRLGDCIGILPDEDAREMINIIEDEFEKVDLDEWK
ncbi:MAG: antitoxin family protein [Spirochaetales bacterium]|nr:antitoxin family protein [Spirochaetales bacterium]